MSLWETYFTDIMAHEKIACPSCGGMVTVGSVCEYCGNFVSSTSFKVDGEKKDAIHTSKQETIRAVQNAENGKWGVLDSEGLQIVPFEYDSVRIVLPFVIIGKKMSLQNNGEKLLLGAYSIKSKKILVPIEYDWIDVKSYRLEDGKCFYLETAKNVFATVGNELRRVRKYGLYNGNSEIELLPCKYERFSYYEGGSYLIFSENYKSGLCNIREGEVMFPCIYKNIWLIGKYVEVTEDKYRGLYDISSNYPIQILPILYEEIRLTDNWLLVKKQYWGISNYAGEEIIPCRYDKIEYDGADNLKLYYGVDNIGTNRFFEIKMDGDRIVKKGSPKMLNGWSVFWSVLCLLGAIFFIGSFGFFYNKFVLCLILCLLAVPVGCIWNALTIRRYKI